MINLKNIYWIGGSPCSGKSTISERLAKEYSLTYYKCDDHMINHMSRGVQNDVAIMKKYSNMSKDENWLRDIDSQVNDVFEFYHESFDFILEDLSTLSMNNGVIVEGSAILPELMKRLSIDIDRCICIVPTLSFQLAKYAERAWVKDYLSDCSDPSKAFSNWMDRDALFAFKVSESARNCNIFVLNVDGICTIDENYEIVKKHFNW